MKALSLTQPWASLVAAGVKRIETRSWPTGYRGELAIHASKGLGSIGGKDGLWRLCGHEPFRSALADAGYKDSRNLPLGAIVAVAELADVLKTEDALSRYVIEGKPEESFGDYSFGRYAWIFENVRPVVPPPHCRGALGLWTVDPDVEKWVRSCLP